MPKIGWLLLITAFAQGQSVPKPVVDRSFDPLVQYFQTAFHWRDRVKPPLIYEPDSADYKSIRVILSDSALGLQTARRLVRVPGVKNPFPLSHSVVYRDHLVSLFEPGQFVCLNLANLVRDGAYEKTLNTKRFQYHWLLNGRLIGLSDSTYFWFDAQTGWRRYTEPVPFGNQPKLYEDDRYISFSTCRGEFGGTLFFYDKRTRLTHFTPSVCANSVLHGPAGYYALASLRSADLSYIENPSRLPVAKRIDRYGIPTADSAKLADTTAPAVLFDYSLKLFSGFLYHGRQTYLAYWGERTFLAEINNGTLFIKDPLFNDDTYTHEPVTTQYPDGTVLINLDFYGAGREREVACLLIRNGTATKLSWDREDLRNWR